MLLVVLGLPSLPTEKFNSTFEERLAFAPHNLCSKSRVHEVATTRVTRVPGPASATCTVVVCLQLIHLSSRNFTWLRLGVKDEFRYRTRSAFDTVAFICHVVVPQKPIYASGESPVRKAPCCNAFKCTSNSNRHRNHFFPVALRMRIPQLRHIGSGLSTSHHLIDCCR